MACCVTNCHNKWVKSTNIIFHMFPNEETREFEQWLEAIGMTYAQYRALPLYRQRVCSRHFSTAAYKERISRNARLYALKKDSIPNLHLHTQNRHVIAECNIPKATEVQHEPAILTTTETQKAQPNLSKECHVSRTFCDVAIQTTISCFDTKEFTFIDNSLTMMSSKLQAYTQTVDDGNSARFCYESIQRSLHMDHSYSPFFNQSVEAHCYKS